MSVTPRVVHRGITIDGVRIAYREAGPSRAPAILLLHGVPSSTRMYEALIRRLGDRFRAVALDYPGFGNSDAPPPGDFAYTFANLANVVAGFADALGTSRYTLFMQD